MILIPFIGYVILSAVISFFHLKERKRLKHAIDVQRNANDDMFIMYKRYHDLYYKEKQIRRNIEKELNKQNKETTKIKPIKEPSGRKFKC